MKTANTVSILFIAPHENLYGACTSILNTARALDRNLFEPHIAAPSEGPLSQGCASEGIPFYARPGLIRPMADGILKWWKVTSSFSAFLKEKKIKILDYTDHPAIDLNMMYFAARLAGAKVVIRNRNIAPYLNLWNKFIVSRADLIISVGSLILDKWLRPRRADIWSKISREKVHVIPDGRLLDKFRVMQKDTNLLWKLGVPTGAKVIGIVGSVQKVKRQDRFIEMAAEIRRRNPHVWFMVVGGSISGALSGYEMELRELAVKLGIADRIIFTGYRKDVPALMKCMDVIVMTSDEEGLPGVLIEARASAIPAVSIDVGDVRSILQDGVNGFVLKGWNPVQYADKVLELLSDTGLYRQMSASAAVNIELFDFNETLNRETGLYCSLLGLPRPAVHEDSSAGKTGESSAAELVGANGT